MQVLDENKKLHSLSLCDLIRGELEVEVYGRYQLVKKFADKVRVVSFPMLMLMYLGFTTTRTAQPPDDALYLRFSIF